MEKIKYWLAQLVKCICIYAIFVLSRLFCRGLLKKEIWLISEKQNEARDNGYHFFLYLKKEHPEVNSFFLIDKESSDYFKMSMYHNCLIRPNSFKHLLYWVVSKYSINSQAYGAYPLNLDYRILSYFKKHILKKQYVVFLQHGILEKELDHSYFDYKRCNIDFFTTSTVDEHSFIREKYGYPEQNCRQVGLCRFDNLFDIPSNLKTILIMPTWRKWLSFGGKTSSTEDLFKKSDYYQTYTSLISNSEFIDYLRRKNVRVIFYLHFEMQKYSGLFEPLNNDVITIAKKEEFDVQDLLKKCNLMLTDYSSVAFDFAYQNKPLIYIQFDKDRYFSYHYGNGYFDYEADGFGPVVKDVNKTIELVKGVVDSDFIQPSIFTDRVKKTFSFRDNSNCERTFLSLIELNL